MMTAKQREYLVALVDSHPNFREETRYNGKMYTDGKERYYRLTGDEWPNDKMYIGWETEVQAKWINSKYGQFLQKPLNTLEDLSKEEASALITHLRLRKK